MPIARRALWLRPTESPQPGSFGLAWPLPHPSPQEEGSWVFWQQGVAWYCAPERDLQLLEATLRPWQIGPGAQVIHPRPAHVLSVVRDPEWDWPTHATLLTPGGDLVFNVPIEQLVMSIEKEAA
ncbi:MAG: hypothetical protein KatS3mg070_2271 [Meiothermus sp.]|uniref:hypothetical protein n=1 Tax=Meiothermus sp. TaxID=1955249 RepID=UPI0021DC264B|nr:hypothetical protein [Meiothermus sp.]GIW28908.1 MAG: hypothetical protein KatS3mg070_2271 [Meiothermus sp.]